jgi:heme oxygenase
LSNLKELTAQQHKRAEGSGFIQRMLKRQMTNYEYYVFMSNQLMSYYVLEACATKKGIFNGIEEIKRSLKIAQDVSEFEAEHGFKPVKPLKSTSKYMEYIENISTDSDRLLAHIYVRHMGDLSGGQIIKRFVPGSGKFYEFETDVNELKEKLRAILHDGLAEEAKVCFDMVTEFMEELETSLGYLGTTDSSSKSTGN